MKYMSTYRVTFDIRSKKTNSGTTLNTTVESESDFMAAKIAEGKLRSQHPSYVDYTFTVKRVEQK
ncbi:hypothetical protein GCM10010080_31120 [Thermomonas carbonis]|nr:hypothetical protein GCM10010080_31120 [Thermomonas carbonis]